MIRNITVLQNLKLYSWMWLLLLLSHFAVSTGETG